MRLSRFTRIVMLAGTLLLCIVTAMGTHKGHKEDPRAKARHFFLKGAVKEAEGNYDQAYEYYKKAYQIDPTYADAGFAHGMSRVLIKEDTFTSPAEIKRSMGYMKALLDENPNDVTIHETYALYAVQADSLPAALDVYKKVVRQHPGYSKVYPALSYLYTKMGETDSALYALREYERLEGVSSETMMRKISLHISKPDTLGAIAEVQKYIDENPNSEEPMLTMAMLYDLLGQPDSAFMMMQQTIEKFPDNGDLKFDMALLCLSRGDTAAYHKYVYEAVTDDSVEEEDILEMLKQYTEALPTNSKEKDAYKESDRVIRYAKKLYPNEIDFLHVYEEYELLKGNKKEAYEISKKTYAEDPQDPYLFGRMMSFGLFADKPEEVMKAFEEYPYPEQRKTYPLIITYISAAQDLKQFDKAVAWSDTLLQAYVPELSVADRLESLDSLKTRDAGRLRAGSAIYEVVGEVYNQMKDTASAKRSYENALLLMPENESALNNYAYYIVETLKAKPGTPEFQKAKDMSYRSLQLTDEEPQSTYYDTYAWILFKENNYKDALTYQEVAIQLAGENEVAELLSHYGDILFMNGRPEDALKQWKRALELEPTDKLLKKKVEHKTFFYE